MNNENFHPVKKIPPNAHALHHWDEKTETLSYEYNGINVISLHIPGAAEAGFRHGSDGNMQSVQFFQQVYVSVDRPIAATATFHLSEDAVCMKPQRAGGNEAIFGQVGRPLIQGISGMYDVNQDFLIDFNGCEWRWLDDEIKTDKSGRSLARAEILLSEKPLFINFRMRYYNKHLGYCYYEPWNRKPNNKSVSGWCSWEAYRRNIDIDKIEHISKFMSDRLKDYGLSYIQVDDGYQKMPLPYDANKTFAEGWMVTDEEKFPQGHESIVKTISDNGFLPAIWTNVNITNKDFPKKYPESIFWNGDKPMDGEWIDFVLTCTPETLKKHVKPAFEAFRKMGYKYVKIDAIRHLLFDGLHEAVRLGLITDEDAQNRFRAFMLATREALGEDVYYLASWGEMHEVVGAADACRISMDANPTWAGIRMQLFESARWFHTQRILFLNDPDHVCVRTKTDWAKSVLSLISLSGELYMLSDSEDAYTNEKLDVVKKTLPPLTTRTAETGPLNVSYPAYTWTKLHGFAVQSHETPVEMEDVSLKDVYNMAGNFPTMDDDHPFSSLWSFHIAHLHRRWCVMGRFATMPLKASDVSLATLGLDSDKEYAAFDFWEQKFLGTVKCTISCRELSVGQCQIVALHPVGNEPMLIASSRHVSMDAVSVLNNTWNGHSLTLRLKGIKGETENYYVYLPSGFDKNIVVEQDCTVTVDRQSNLLKVSVKFLNSEATVSLGFK